MALFVACSYAQGNHMRMIFVLPQRLHKEQAVLPQQTADQIWTMATGQGLQPLRLPVAASNQTKKLAKFW